MNASTRMILIIDGDAADRERIRALLQQGRARQYEVIEAADGASALEMIRDRPIDCVLLDFYLPDMDGVEFLRRARDGSGAFPPVPATVLTDEESDQIAALALSEGAQDYLVKTTLTAPVLMRAIENSIAKHGVQRDLIESRIALEMRNQKLEMLRDQLQGKIDELAKATQAKDQFMAVMSHEMRTPLNAIIGYADLLDLELDGTLGPVQRQYIERIHVGGRHLLDLINDVLDLARADANRLEVDLRSVDLAAVMDEVGALLHSQARAKGIELTVTACDGPIAVHADLNRLRQVLMNIIGNAVKFTEEGEVRVSCETREDGRVAVRVADTGIGIDPKILPLIFNEFYQVRGELTREKGGSGLGLAISRKLAELMDAEIEAESHVGEGSVFTVILQPARPGSEVREHDDDVQDARRELHTARPSRGEPVPVVAFSGDEGRLGELERHVSPGVRLLWSTDPDRVVALAEREKPALVVLDISTGDGAAWRVAYALQETQDLASTAILLLPSIPEPAEAPGGAGFDLGWLSIVPKPFTAAQLTQAVSTAAMRGDRDGKGLERHDVLVVDDDPDSRRVAAKFLLDAGVQVREATDGEHALIEMRRQVPDVTVLDLMMPVLDGFGVLATMRADPMLASVPVVVLTAKNLTEGERRFLSRTAVNVLQKGEHRLADVAALVIRAAERAHRPMPAVAAAEPAGPEEPAILPEPASDGGGE